MSHNIQFPSTGLVRIRQILAPEGPIPVSKSTWWAGIRDGRFPKPMKLGARISVWRAEDILALTQSEETKVTGAIQNPPECNSQGAE